MVDVVAVPNRLEDGVGEPQHQDVLHGLLAQVMIDAIDLVFVENAMHGFVQALRRIGVAAERLFDDDPPRPVHFVGQSASAEALHRLFVELRRRGQVVDARHAVGAFQRA